MRPVIGVTTWRRRLDTYLGREDLHTLATFYVDALIGAGTMPLLIPNGQESTEAADVLSVVDGLVLSGGDDVDPPSYGAEPTASRGSDSRVDRFELALIDAAQRTAKPLLAICRGLQVLNVALGGTLRQEVTSPGGVHELIEPGLDPEELSRRRHVVLLEPGGLLAGIYGTDEIEVNSLHHQGIDVLASDLVVEGRSDDGLVEGVRYGDGWWALGVQWHPERMTGVHRRIFEVFADEALTRRR